MAASFVPLPGSERAPAPEAREIGPLDGSSRLTITLVLRRRAELPRDLIEGPSTISRQELGARYGADPADIDLVRRVLSRYGLEVTEGSPESRQMKVSGSIDQLCDVFGARLIRVSSPDPTTGAPVEHRHREGSLRIPAELDGVVRAVLGLDDRPQARAHMRRAAAIQYSYTPPQLAGVYRFPAGTDGSGQTLGIIELGGGFRQSELENYFSALGMPTPSVTAVDVAGGTNAPGNNANGPDGEVLLDIEVAGSLAAGAAQVVYFAPNSDLGFAEAIYTAVNAAPTPAAISISWGHPENTWTLQALNVFEEVFADAAALGVTVCAAAGDNGSGDGESDGQPHTDFPASSPYVLACGGTRLEADPATGQVTSETVWNDQPLDGATGGGISEIFPLPAWQEQAGVPHNGQPGRGEPDVAADADPATGYQILVDGRSQVIGGTSAVAPLWAALVCRLTQALGRPLGLLQPALYAGVQAGQTPPGFRPITSGNNGAYTAGPGWNACTGLGTPDGTALLEHLAGAR